MIYKQQLQTVGQRTLSCVLNDTYTLHFTLYDHFGLDLQDVVDQGVCTWYILQHYAGYNNAYRPFLTLIEFDITFTGLI